MEYFVFIFSFFFIDKCCFTPTAIATVVTIAEILKNNGLAVEKSEFPILMFSFD